MEKLRIMALSFHIPSVKVNSSGTVIALYFRWQDRCYWKPEGIGPSFSVILS